jgi:hypothetical protein
MRKRAAPMQISVQTNPAQRHLATIGKVMTKSCQYNHFVPEIFGIFVSNQVRASASTNRRLD